MEANTSLIKIMTDFMGCEPQRGLIGNVWIFSTKDRCNDILLDFDKEIITFCLLTSDGHKQLSYPFNKFIQITSVLTQLIQCEQMHTMLY